MNEAVQVVASYADAQLGSALIPDQSIQPIDLPGAMRLAGARDLDVAIAREAQAFMTPA